MNKDTLVSSRALSLPASTLSPIRQHRRVGRASGGTTHLVAPFDPTAEEIWASGKSKQSQRVTYDQACPPQFCPSGPE